LFFFLFLGPDHDGRARLGVCGWASGGPGGTKLHLHFAYCTAVAGDGGICGSTDFYFFALDFKLVLKLEV
jgi:hypothetical protein